MSGLIHFPGITGDLNEFKSRMGPKCQKIFSVMSPSIHLDMELAMHTKLEDRGIIVDIRSLRTGLVYR